MKRLKIILLTICLGGLTFNANAESTSNSVAVSSPTIITENSKLPEFQYTLSLAKKVGYPKTVALIENEDYGKAIEQLKTEFYKGPIEGYKKGFFNEALRGICLEKLGKIVQAYRAYQNARYYCEEEKAGTLDKPLPAPKLEVYVGIGRMCNRAGRYTDALNYLNNARLEAAEYLSVAVAADRGLIKRAEDLGELEELLFLFEDLKNLRYMRKSDCSSYAETLFRTGKDRAGFKLLLNSMIENGIDNNLGRKDTLMKTFLDNFARTDDNEINLFYDVLGSEIQNARMKKGDETYISFLLSSRFMLCKLCDYLGEEDDLQKVKAKITKIKIENQDSVATNDNKIINKINKRRKKNKRKKSSKIAQDTQAEDQLMQAEINFKNKSYKAALVIYQSILSNLNNQVDQENYDDTTLKQATEVGYYGCQFKLNRKICDVPIELKNHLIRDNILGLLLYSRATNDILETKYESYFLTPGAIKFSHPIYMKRRLLRNIIKNWGQQGNIWKVRDFFNKTSTNDIYILREISYENGIALLCQAKFYKSFQNDLIRAKYEVPVYNNFFSLGFGSQKEILEILNIRQKKTMVRCLGVNPSLSSLSGFVRSGKLITNFKDVFKFIESKNYDKALISYDVSNDILYNQSSTGWLKALICFEQGNYQNANNCLRFSLSRRESMIHDFTNNKISAKLSSREIEIIELYKNYIKPESLEWISKYQ